MKFLILGIILFVAYRFINNPTLPPHDDNDSEYTDYEEIKD
jgi:hypothetical protein